MSFNKVTRSACALLLGAALSTAWADASTDKVEAAVNDFIGQPAVESVSKTQYGGLYEVVLKNHQILYTDENLSFLMDGRLIDAKSRTDVTAERMNKLLAVDFSTLPLENAFKIVRGDGSRVIATFEDPNCGYCKRLAKDLAEMDNITIYTFLYPVLGSDSVVKSRNIWCAKDQLATWNNWMLKGEQPATAECEQTTTIDKNIALGQSMRITGTPTLFLQDGTRIGGYLPKDQLEVAIADATAKAKEETVQTTQ